MLVTTRSDRPRRVDVIPVTLWDPTDDQIAKLNGRGQRVWVTAAVQRRFWAGPEGRTSRIEIVAHTIELRDDDATDPCRGGGVMNATNHNTQPADELADKLERLTVEIRNLTTQLDDAIRPTTPRQQRAEERHHELTTLLSYLLQHLTT